MKHTILYDRTCPVCRRSMAFVKKIDKKRIFKFESLKVPSNTLILIENNKKWTRGRGVFRIFWLIGGRWKLIGWLCFIPFGIDQAYSLFATMRHKIK